MSNPADVLAVARHVSLDEIPWVPNLSYPGTEMRLLQADVDAGVYAMAGRMHAGLEVGQLLRPAWHRPAVGALGPDRCGGEDVCQDERCSNKR